jgi:hypothetical protein
MSRVNSAESETRRWIISTLNTNKNEKKKPPVFLVQKIACGSMVFRLKGHSLQWTTLNLTKICKRVQRALRRPSLSLTDAYPNTTVPEIKSLSVCWLYFECNQWLFPFMYNAELSINCTHIDVVGSLPCFVKEEIHKTPQP